MSAFCNMVTISSNKTLNIFCEFGTLKPRNQETKKPRNQEANNPRNQEIKKQKESGNQTPRKQESKKPRITPTPEHTDHQSTMFLCYQWGGIWEEPSGRRHLRRHLGEAIWEKTSEERHLGRGIRDDS